MKKLTKRIGSSWHSSGGARMEVRKAGPARRSRWCRSGNLKGKIWAQRSPWFLHPWNRYEGDDRGWDHHGRNHGDR